MRIYWTNRAQYHLRRIRKYLTSQTTEAFADETIAKLVIRSQSINELPHMGKRVPEFRQENIREISVRPYRIIYYILPDLNRIDIIAVTHYRQLLPDNLNELLTKNH